MVRKIVKFYSYELEDEPPITGDEEHEEVSDIFYSEDAEGDNKVEELKRKWEEVEKQEEDFD